MSKTRQPDKLRPAARRLSWCAGVAVGLFLLTAGCNGTAHTHSGDPLFGEYYPKGPNGQPLPPNSAPTKTSAVGVPPYPTANAASSTAAIANNTNLPGGRPLAINENGGTNWTLTNTTNNTANPPIGLGKPTIHEIPRDTTGPVAGTAAPAVPKVVPIPSTDARAGSPIVTAGSWTSGPTGSNGAAPSTTTAAPNAEALQKSLEAKGAIGIKQENLPDGVRVSCFLPQGAGSFRHLETVAHDFPTGLQALARQVDP